MRRNWFTKLFAGEKRLARRAYAAAASNRLLADWVFSGIANHERVKADWLTTTMRARDHAQNNAYGRKFLQMVVKNVVGTGFRLNVVPRDARGGIDKAAGDMIEDAFRRWGENPQYCDMAGRKTWLDFQHGFIRTVARDGHSLIRMVSGADNPFAFGLKAYDPRVLDVDKNDANPGNGNQIIMGVEVNTWGKPVAYHLKRTSDNSIETEYRYGDRHERIPAEEIIMWGIEEYDDQIRYMTWMACGMVQMQHLAKYEEAELIASRMAAAKTGFLIQKEGPNYDPDEEESDGAYRMKQEPGEVQLLPPGWDYKANDPQHPTTAYPSARKGFLQGISSALGVAYNGLANDLEGVNFSSIRSGVLDERDEWMMLQALMARHFCHRVYSNWLRAAMLTGQVNLPLAKIGKFINADTWLGRRWMWVDPLKDAQTNEILVRHGWKTNGQITAEIGGNYEDNVDAITNEPQLPGSDTETTNGQANTPGTGQND